MVTKPSCECWNKEKIKQVGGMIKESAIVVDIIYFDTDGHQWKTWFERCPHCGAKAEVSDGE